MVASKIVQCRWGRSGGQVRFVTLFFCFFVAAVRLQATESTTRIVSLLPNFTETLFAIGAERQLVGVSDFCKYPPQATQRPRVGGLLNPSLERIVALRPTTVVVSVSQSELANKLEQLGVATRQLHSDSLADIYEAVAVAGALTNETTRAAALARQIRHELAELRDRYSTAPKQRVLIVVARAPSALQGMYAVGKRSYLSELVEMLGAENVVHSDAPAVPLSKEELVRANPEVILDFSMVENGKAGAAVEAHRRAWYALSAVKAVRHNQIHFLQDPHFTIPGPTVAETARALARALYADALLK